MSRTLQFLLFASDSSRYKTTIILLHTCTYLRPVIAHCISKHFTGTVECTRCNGLFHCLRGLWECNRVIDSNAQVANNKDNSYILTFSFVLASLSQKLNFPSEPTVARVPCVGWNAMSFTWRERQKYVSHRSVLLVQSWQGIYLGSVLGLWRLNDDIWRWSCLFACRVKNRNNKAWRLCTQT